METLHFNTRAVLNNGRGEITSLAGGIKTVALFGSARDDQNTCVALAKVLKGKTIDVVKLNSLVLAGFDYQFRNHNDDFLSLITSLMRYERWILATPVYWYSMSASMKAFVERLNDIVYRYTWLKEDLAGKKIFLIAANGSAEKYTCFEEVFRLMASYLKLEYEGAFIYHCGADQERRSTNDARAEAAHQLLWSS